MDSVFPTEGANTTFLAVALDVETLMVLPSLKLGLADRLVATIVIVCFDLDVFSINPVS